MVSPDDGLTPIESALADLWADIIAEELEGLSSGNPSNRDPTCVPLPTEPSEVTAIETASQKWAPRP